MPAKPLYTSGERPAERRPIPEPATDAFPAEEDVSVPPPGSDQTVGSEHPEAAAKGRPRKPA